MNRKTYVAYNFNCCLETEGLLKVMYTEKIVIFQKWCKIKTLLQTSN